MPPNFKFTREEILRAALDLVRENGLPALTARALAARLGSSPKPIFGLFESMEEVQREVLNAANALYHSYLQEDMSRGDHPPYKASGMGYIRFAQEERELFKLLFMRDRSNEAVGEDREEIRPLLDLLQASLGLSEEDAYLFHLEMWLYVHGIASMIATGYLNWDMSYVSRALTDGYIGLRYRYCGEENGHGSH